MIDQEAIEGVMGAVEDDYLDMTDIIYHVRDQAPDDATLLRIAATVADLLIRHERIVPGYLTDNGFAPWPTAPAESARRIIEETDAWADAKKEVYPGIIAWFDTPEAIAERAAGNDPSHREEQ